MTNLRASVQLAGVELAMRMQYNASVIKPTVFIGSSTRHLATANAIKGLLISDADARVWNEGVFSLNNSTLDDLLKAVDEFDFAVFVFAADDLICTAQAEVAKVRDNVVFELGLFMGRLGKGRAFWIVPRATASPVIPTDLLGVTYGGFDSPDRSTELISESLRGACNQIGMLMKKAGRRTDRLLFEFEQPSILCVASPQFFTPEFQADHRTLVKNFPDAVIDAACYADPDSLAARLSSAKWDFIHLAALVDPRSGDIVLDRSVRAGADGRRLRAEGFVKLMELMLPRLVAIPTCDSLALASQLSRITNVIAGKRMIEARASQQWAVHFYRQIGNGQPLSEAFALSQAITNTGLVLIARQDLRVIRA
jgi:predicted nucleotide-binding protein